MSHTFSNTQLDNSRPIEAQEWSAIFLLDVVARYAVDRCGADDDIFTAIASVACVLPIWIWVCSLVLLLVDIELYLILARYSLTMLTFLQIILVVVFQESPPVHGCGPSLSYPNPQTAMSAYSLAIYVCYIKIDPSSQHRHVWLLAVMALQNCLVIQSVLWLGFASPIAAIAGCAIGTMSACLLHEILGIITTHRCGWFVDTVHCVEQLIGVFYINTLLGKQDNRDDDDRRCDDDDDRRCDAVAMGYTTSRDTRAENTAYI
jgi:hypothetical protein